MKKLFAVLMAIALVLSMGTTFAFAADTGKIQITNAISGADYTVYKMLDFKAVEGSTDKGIYTIATGWENFFNNDATAQEYFAIDNTRSPVTVSLKDGKTADQTIAQAALAYAKNPANNITATAADTADGDTVEFTGLKLGYYAIDTTVGTMGALTRASNVLTAVEKNEMPDISKQVQEDADDSWGAVNDADINQEVNYKATITLGTGAVNYIMHDTMEEGLTFNYNEDDPDASVVVTANGAVVSDDKYDVVYYGVYGSPDDGVTFDVKFKDSFIAELEAAGVTSFTVEYSATLNEKAKIAYDGGNINDIYLSAGENNEWETEHDQTSTFTWKMDVFKYMKESDADDAQKIALAGAKFQLINAKNEVINFVRIADTDGVPTYRVAVDGDTDVTDTIVTEETTGKFIIVGLDEGAYKLHETEAPAGYNKLAADLDVIITSVHSDADLTATYKINNADPATIEVENKTGGLFPETGGIGTTIFYLVGGLLMVAAFVFLVSKKRMATAA